MAARDQTSLRRIGGIPADENRDAGLDVIFVHGLGGDHDSTWRLRGQQDCWLDWLAEDMKDVTIWSLGYPADATQWTSGSKGMALSQRVSGLMDRLLHNGIGSRGIVFVCHSLGGLVVKQMLRHSLEMNKEEWHAIVGATIAVAFIATPHTGAPLASIANAFRLSRSTRTLLALEAHCPHLQELDDWYRQNVAALNIQTAAYAEIAPVRVFRGWFRTFMVVPVGYADPKVDGCVLTHIDADHVDICKPASREADIYLGIKSFVSKQIARLAAGVSLGLPAGITVDDAKQYPEALEQSILEVKALRDRRLLGSMEMRMIKIGLVRDYYRGAGQ
ncbi:esterase/lipase family protein [Nocardia gipuzkoensis]